MEILKESNQEPAKEVYKARSIYNKGTEKNTLHEVLALVDCRKRKGKKGTRTEYKVQWASKNETWEPENILKEDIPTLLENYCVKESESAK